jgi:hypothetical protein
VWRCRAIFNQSDPGDAWGPWSDGLTDAQRRESILVLRTLASMICTRQSPLWKALYRAYAAAGARGLALLEAAIELERLPALTRRNLISSYAGNMLLGDAAPTPRRGRPVGITPAKAERKGAAA